MRKNKEVASDTPLVALLEALWGLHYRLPQRDVLFLHRVLRNLLDRECPPTEVELLKISAMTMRFGARIALPPASWSGLPPN